MIKQIGRRIYYEISTGNVLVDTREKAGFVRETTIEEDINAYKILSKRNRESFDYIELPFGAYAQDFAECNGYQVNIKKLATLPDDEKHKALEFIYPDPNVPQEEQEPVYQAPLSVKVEQLKQENLLLKAQNAALTERTDFHEDVLTELILEVYSL